MTTREEAARAERERRQELLKTTPESLGFEGEDFNQQWQVYQSHFNEAVLDGLDEGDAHAYAKRKTGIDPTARALDVEGAITAPFAAWLKATGGGPFSLYLIGVRLSTVFPRAPALAAAQEAARYWNRGDHAQAAQELQRAFRRAED